MGVLAPLGPRSPHPHFSGPLWPGKLEIMWGGSPSPFLLTSDNSEPYYSPCGLRRGWEVGNWNLLPLSWLLPPFPMPSTLAPGLWVPSLRFLQEQGPGAPFCTEGPAHVWSCLISPWPNWKPENDQISIFVNARY